MTSSVSTNYRELLPDEIPSVAAACADAWMDYKIPVRQWEIVKPELEKLRQGTLCPPFDALIQCMSHIPTDVLLSRPRLLDIGASSGYYREVLTLAGFDVRYTGCDVSRAFQRFALAQYPDIDFDLANACSLPYHDDTFPIVLSGAALMHIRDYAQAIREGARVSFRYVIFHRTPIVFDGPTRFFQKDGYGVPMLEIHFSETELFGLFDQHRLRLIYACDVFRHADLVHRTYLLEKPAGLNHIQV